MKLFIQLFLYFFIIIAEPNNESPLNPTAARLWDTQAVYRKRVHEEYDSKVKGKFDL